MGSAGCTVESVSLDCRDPMVRELLAGYLRYLAPGLAQLGSQPLSLRLRVLAPEKMSAVPVAAQPVSRYANYRMAGLGRHLFYDSGRGACLRVTPASYEYLHGRDLLADPGRTIGVLIEAIQRRTAVTADAR